MIQSILEEEHHCRMGHSVYLLFVSGNRNLNSFISETQSVWSFSSKKVKSRLVLCLCCVCHGREDRWFSESPHSGYSLWTGERFSDVLHNNGIQFHRCEDLHTKHNRHQFSKKIPIFSCPKRPLQGYLHHWCNAHWPDWNRWGFLCFWNPAMSQKG